MSTEVKRLKPTVPDSVTTQTQRPKTQPSEPGERERELQRRLTRWGIMVESRGERYEDCTLSNFETYDPSQTPVIEEIRDYGENLKERVETGKSIILYGPPGTGKDHFMASLMRHAVVGLGIYVRWVNGLDLFGDVRDGFSNHESERYLIEKLTEPDVLALSDPIPPWGKLSEFQASFLLRIIDARYSRRRATWLTINVKNAQEASERLGSALIDRMKENAVALHCNWPSYRERQG